MMHFVIIFFLLFLTQKSYHGTNPIIPDTKNVGHIQPTNAHGPFHWWMVLEKAHILTWYLYGLFSQCTVNIFEL